ncbi:glutathione-disulfide reductase [Comamonas serinivorans]|uniref:Glutathione-disulfide reductase n=1 Tax=Comamonas serinivorans TaxID=1082851 RepID=A0A1Y0ENG9_9BURK|nr:glutathione-disulfide reductase [Comamonas serinivorans]ARU05185.1 glutathione-disulfide reductase [Comamonas serinivorans]
MTSALPPSFDLIVIGGGSGGVRAARFAAQRGARVAVVESGPMGGTCVNVGCVPKKMYSFAAQHGEDMALARGYGWRVPDGIALDWAHLKRVRAAEISRLNGIYEGLMSGAKVERIAGHASLTPQAGEHHTVQVALTAGGTRALQARHVLIATGGRPRMPQLPGIELAVSSDDMFDLPVFPKRLLVVGGGYIACEMASIFNGMGAETHLIYRGEQPLKAFDDEVARFVTHEMRGHHIQLHLSAVPKALTRLDDGSVRLTTADGRSFDGDTVLMAIGREANTAGLNLEAAGVATRDSGQVQVNERFETSVTGIYALGDVVGRMELTPVALAEAMALVDQLYGPAPGKAARQMNYDNIPTAVFTHPAIGTVGLTEAQARDRHAAIEVYRTDYKPLRHALSGSASRELIKLIVDAQSQRVVGAHMVGQDAGEIIQGMAVAIQAGATKAQFDQTIGIHPTSAEEFVTLREVSRR